MPRPTKGDRQLNRAFHTIVLSRMRWDAYVKRRTAEGETPREIKRCLKRYVARELFRLVENESSGTP
jgi:transposase